ncbi:MAG: hypothetical protein U0X75_23745 [Acidobacteriota bacterium]
MKPSVYVANSNLVHSVAVAAIRLIQGFNCDGTLAVQREQGFVFELGDARAEIENGLSARINCGNSAKRVRSSGESHLPRFCR